MKRRMVLSALTFAGCAGVALACGGHGGSYYISDHAEFHELSHGSGGHVDHGAIQEVLGTLHQDRAIPWSYCQRVSMHRMA